MFKSSFSASLQCSNNFSKEDLRKEDLHEKQLPLYHLIFSDLRANYNMHNEILYTVS